MSENQPTKSGLGPYELVFRFFSSIRRNPAAAFVFLFALLLFIYGVLLVLAEPSAEYRVTYQAMQIRAYVLGVSCVVMSGFLFVGGCILTTRRKD